MARRPAAAGFTLIEVLIALALQLIALYGLMSLPLAAVRGGDHARRVGEAVGLAQDRLEALRHTPIPQLANGSETAIDSSGAAGGPFTRTTTITVDGAGRASIQVQVQWTGMDGRAHAVTVRSVRAP
jgi:prepilin-type N-terminal cleavage/methylation domain-containing protein